MASTPPQVQFTAERINDLQITTTVGTALSCASLVAFLVTYIVWKPLRKSTGRYAIYTSIFMFLGCFGNFIGRWARLGSPLRHICQFDAWLISFGDIFSWGWVLTMAISCLWTLIFTEATSADNPSPKRKVYELIFWWPFNFAAAWGFSIGPLFVRNYILGRMYGDAIEWCWIHANYAEYRTYLYYVPLWIVLGFVCCIWILATFTSYAASGLFKTSMYPYAVSATSQGVAYVHHYSCYMLMFGFIWFFPTIDQAYALTHGGQRSYALLSLNTLFYAFRGILWVICIAYAHAFSPLAKQSSQASSYTIRTGRSSTRPMRDMTKTDASSSQAMIIPMPLSRTTTVDHSSTVPASRSTSTHSRRPSNYVEMANSHLEYPEQFRRPLGSEQVYMSRIPPMPSLTTATNNERYDDRDYDSEIQEQDVADERPEMTAVDIASTSPTLGHDDYLSRTRPDVVSAESQYSESTAPRKISDPASMSSLGMSTRGSIDHQKARQRLVTSIKRRPRDSLSPTTPPSGMPSAGGSSIATFDTFSNLPIATITGPRQRRRSSEISDMTGGSPDNMSDHRPSTIDEVDERSMNSHPSPAKPSPLAKSAQTPESPARSEKSARMALWPSAPLKLPDVKRSGSNSSSLRGKATDFPLPPSQLGNKKGLGISSSGDDPGTSEYEQAFEQSAWSETSPDLTLRSTNSDNEEESITNSPLEMESSPNPPWRQVFDYAEGHMQTPEELEASKDRHPSDSSGNSDPGVLTRATRISSVDHSRRPTLVMHNPKARESEAAQSSGSSLGQRSPDPRFDESSTRSSPVQLPVHVRSLSRAGPVAEQQAAAARSSPMTEISSKTPTMSQFPRGIAEPPRRPSKPMSDFNFPTEQSSSSASPTRARDHSPASPRASMHTIETIREAPSPRRGEQQQQQGQGQGQGQGVSGWFNKLIGREDHPTNTGYPSSVASTYDDEEDWTSRGSWVDMS